MTPEYHVSIQIRKRVQDMIHGVWWFCTCLCVPEMGGCVIAQMPELERDNFSHNTRIELEE